MKWSPRLALEQDIPALEILIPLSVRILQAPFYSPAQMDAAMGGVFGVDRQLIQDDTYYVVESDGEIVGCGGWSRRKSLYGSDAGRSSADMELDPRHDPARVRAFFVRPGWSRRGIARAILQACEQAIFAAGFRSITLVATLAGEPLYASAGYLVAARHEIPLPGGLALPAITMNKRLDSMS